VLELSSKLRKEKETTQGRGQKEKGAKSAGLKSDDDRGTACHTLEWRRGGETDIAEYISKKGGSGGGPSGNA